MNKNFNFVWKAIIGTQSPFFNQILSNVKNIQIIFKLN